MNLEFSADTLGKFAPALVQVGRGGSRKPALGAYEALKEKATYAKSLRLAALAARGRPPQMPKPWSRECRRSRDPIIHMKA